MISLSVQQLQQMIYDGMLVVVNQCNVKPQGWVESALLFNGLHERAGKMALAADNSPIDLERIASII